MAPVLPDSAPLAHGLSSTFRRNVLSGPLSSALHDTQLIRRTTAGSPYIPGQGAKLPQTINNRAYFALFALLGAAMVVASIWFFFWAKNGGFVWREGDWDDYKSTVLRRKGPDGKTLSNATKSTKLGQQSIAGTFSNCGGNEKVAASDYGYRATKGKQKKSRPYAPKKREPSDEDVRAYRHEKPALVGGLNRHADGSHFDYTNTDRSDLSSQPLRPKPASPKKKGFMDKKREKQEIRRKEERAKKNKSRDHLLGDQASTVATSSVADTVEAWESDHNDTSYYAAYRPPVAPYANRHSSPHGSPHRSRPNSASQPRQSSPIKHSSRPQSTYAYSEAGSSEHGTRSYPHYIPDPGRNARDTGYRRDAFGGRRDSLSDSDGDLASHRY